MTQRLIRLVLPCLIATTTLLLNPGVADAVLLTATDGNTLIRVDSDDDEDGLVDWLVDGVDQIFENFYYLRFGPAGSLLGPEDSLVDMLSPLSTSAAGNVATLGYGNGTLTADLVYTVFGGTAGSGNSTVQIDITLTNISAGPLDVVWFNNPDLDLNASDGNETGVFTLPGTVVQTDQDGITTATYTSSIAPNAWHMDSAGTVQSPLDNGTVLTNLLNATSPFGPADVAFAFQHNFLNIAAAGSVSYTETLTLTTIPEPASLVLLALGGLALLPLRRRVRR